jgi:crotonobetainyl-CoA:carnitine CoA-transferase CaiB-like acyl-CoA transferase
LTEANWLTIHDLALPAIATEIVTGLFRKFPKLRLLKANNVPCGPINDIKQVFEDAQVDHRQMKL